MYNNSRRDEQADCCRGILNKVSVSPVLFTAVQMISCDKVLSLVLVVFIHFTERQLPRHGLYRQYTVELHTNSRRLFSSTVHYGMASLSISTPPPPPKRTFVVPIYNCCESVWRWIILYSNQPSIQNYQHSDFWNSLGNSVINWKITKYIHSCAVLDYSF